MAPSDPNKPSTVQVSTPVAGPAVAGTDRGKVVRAAMAMAVGTLSSRVLGLVREMVLAALFSRAITDAWIAAFRLPNMFRRLLGEGSLSVSFVPIFVEAKAQNPGPDGAPSLRAREMLDGFFTLLVGLLSVLTILGILFPEPALRLLLDPSYIAQAEKFAMTVHMAKIMFGFVFLISTYAFFMGVLNALGIFGLPAMAPLFFNIAMLISTLMPPGWFPMPGDGLAWGVIAGGFLQMIILIPALWKRGYLPRISFRWNNPDIKRVLWNMLPGIAGLGLLQVTTVVNMRFASQLGEGPISWINWADRLLELPLSLVSVSLGTALLPTLSGLWAQGEKRKMSDTMNFSLRLNLFVCVAAAAGLYALAVPIVEVIFQRGRFTAADTLATAGVVRIWAMIMIPTACVRVLAPAYYAVKNTWFPALVSATCLCVHLIAAPLLMAKWGLSGLNSSSLLSSSLNFIFLLSFFRILIADFSYGRLLWHFVRFLIPAAALVAAVQIHAPLVEVLGTGGVMKILALLISVLAGAVAYALTARVIGLEEWHATAERLVTRLRGKLAAKK